MNSTFNLPLVGEIEELVQDHGVRLFLHDLRRLSDPPPFECSRFTIDAGQQTSLDQHEVCEIWFVSKGDVSVFVDGVWHQVKRGKLLHFQSRQKHYVRNDGLLNAEIFSVWWRAIAPSATVNAPSDPRL